MGLLSAKCMQQTEAYKVSDLSLIEKPTKNASKRK